MAWLTSAPTPWTTSRKRIIEQQWNGYVMEGVFYITGQQSRTRTITTQRYAAMTETVANNLVDTLAATANVVDAHAERENDAGAYAVIVTYDVKGAWA